MAGLSLSPAWSQSTATGTVSGQVTDAQSAAVSGTEVKLVDTSTNKAQATTTNDSGRYTFQNVQPATYSLTFNKPGFSTYQVNTQTVVVGQVLTINAQLTVGATTTTVEVTSVAGAELQTTNATVGQTLTGDSLIFLPNLGREAAALTLYQPGVSPEGAVAGAMNDQNTFQLDGGNNSNDMDGNMTVYTPSYASNGAPTGTMPTPVESIEEFKVSTSGMTADFNGSSGSQVQMVTKRGSNTIHGSIYENYFASDWGAANSWDNNHTPSGSLGYTPLPITHYNRFGAALGGPIIPKNLLGGKWYGFFNYEGFRYPQSAIVSKAVPTATLRAGVIFVNQGAAGYVPYNLNNSAVTVNGTTYQPAVCPAGSCDPRGLGFNPVVSQLWSKYMPLPNTNTGGDHYNTLNYQGIVSLPVTSNQYTGRIDHDFTDKWHFMTSYRSYKYIPLTTSQVDYGGAIGNDKLGTPTALAQRPQDPSYWVAGLTTTINSTMTNDFRFSYLRNFWQWGTAGATPQLPGLGGALEIGGESSGALIPYNVNTQSVRQRFWDGQDKMLRDDVTKVKGNHQLSFGGQYQRNFDYHLRNDNGQGIMNAPVYQITNGPGVAYPSQYRPSTIPVAQTSNWNKLYSEVLGIVSQPQDLYTRSGPQLTLQPPGSFMYDQSVIPSYNVYFSDVWRMKPTLTLSYGLGYTLEMPPYELNGKQVELTDTSGKPFDVQSYLDARKSAALAGSVYNPTVAWATVKNVTGASTKYPYNPFYGGVSPHVAVAWNPRFTDGIMGKVFGNGKTVVRGGYSRVFSRLNGVGLVLVPLLGTGLGQAVSCIGASRTGQCLGTGGVDPTTAFRIGADGLVAPLGGAPSQTLPQPYIPGVNGNPASGSGSVLDPKFRPARTENFNLSIQRELNTHAMLEVGYIGRIIRNEWQQSDLDAVPYMTTLGGQSFAQAFAQTYFAVAGTPSGTVGLNAQPFFENALGGANSSFCKGFASCTAAVANNSTMNSFIANNQVYQLWAALNGTSSWTLGRTMPSTASPAIPAGQLSAVYYDDSVGFGNYNAAYVSLTLRDYHGVTARSNFTYGRALGTGNSSQATSSYSTLDPWNVRANYGPQYFDYKFVYNLTMVWQDPYFKRQHGVMGHLLGGWVVAPLFTFHTGQPLGIFNLNGGCESFGEMNCSTGSTNANNSLVADGAVLAAPFTGGNSAHYNLNVPDTGSGAGVNSNPSNGGNGINAYTNPDQIYKEFRPCILGYDTSCGGGGVIRGLGFWNLDATVSKDIGVWKEGRVGATLIFQFNNLLNHTQLGDPYLDISDPADWGVLGTNNVYYGGQVNSPRSIQFGFRIHW
ncbi:MAG TPA: carboxypeptidase-like regulatory domain-containing protein [Candidatus Sulfopaludibacter sp.]|jgi:hypothetical protein|nr:carboxypeptidase-like regulatory domain-containing protein [Candidatus Sulfopaludibacter sp.]